jgi:hypothetical protein
MAPGLDLFAQVETGIGILEEGERKSTGDAPMKKGVPPRKAEK